MLHNVLKFPQGHADILQLADMYRLEAAGRPGLEQKSQLGQFFTPAPVAAFMASLFRSVKGAVRVLDPGAGTGSLTAAFVQNILENAKRVTSVTTDLYEIDTGLTPWLDRVLNDCQAACAAKSIGFSSNLFTEDFIKSGSEILHHEGGLLSGKPVQRYTHCIMNPPYKKIRSNSDHRLWLRQAGIETVNLYSGFLAIAIKLLEQNGELVAIVPRSFCNGPYFKPFRQLLLGSMALKHIHVFEARDRAFKEDNVLQENIIFHAVKGGAEDKVVITSSHDQTFEGMTHREVNYDKVIKPSDPDKFIYIAPSDFDQSIVDHISVFKHTLDRLGIDVCTGQIVDFRLKEDIRIEPESGAYPLIYPGHFSGHYIEWPRQQNGVKANAIFESSKNKHWLMPNGWYVLTRRFSAKEEKRRIVAAVNDPGRIGTEKIAFENHLNVFHQNGKGLDPLIAKGLALYLNSSLADQYFRLFSGHTQVNAADLRAMHYPDLPTLARLGEQAGSSFPDQSLIDKILEKEINNMAETKNQSPLEAQKKIEEALVILKILGLPKGQQNERSALTLLALLNLKPAGRWQDAKNPLIGITPIMDFSRDFYGRNYAPNTRETFRRQTMHQFVDAGIAVVNPDRPDRPINSPKWVYQIENDALTLIRSYGQKTWEDNLKTYLEKHKALALRYAKERAMQMIPLVINSKTKVELTPGAHSQLIKDIIEQFGPRFAPGAEVVYIGDTGSKMVHFDEAVFKELGLSMDSHGKFPDVVMYYRKKNWLLLIESVTSHGPVNPKRHSELSKLFKDCKAGLVYVTAFPDRQIMAKYLPEISWETEVWIAETPSHIIHFNGERFLGPYEESGS